MTKTSIKVAVLFLISLGAVAPLRADEYPNRIITIVVPYTPAGGADILARTIAPSLEAELGQRILIDNRPGANGIVGTSAVSHAAPDGYTLLLANVGPSAINQSLYPDLPYDCVKGFSPIGEIGITNHILAVNPQVPARSVTELAALARSQPGKLTFGSTGIGGSPHLAAELFKLMAGVDILHVPYRGAGPANVDLIAGRIDMVFNTLPTLAGYVEPGTIRALAVTGTRRSELQPALPTIAESGLAGYDVTTWYGLLAPPELPRSIVQRLNSALNKILAVPELRAKLRDQGYEVATGTPEEFGTLIATDVEKWAEVVKRANVKAR